VPPQFRCGTIERMPTALNEMQVGRLMTERAALDGHPLNFAGAGAYEHHIPAAVWAIATRGEYYSAYTPYQAEASQGTLQTIYEFQTMIAGLTGMDVANASLYDGASALAEACLMAVRAQDAQAAARVLLPASVNPAYRQCVATIAGLQDVALLGASFDPAHGRLDVRRLCGTATPGISALVIQQPNYFGVLEDVDALTDWAHASGALVIAVVNPTSLAVLKPPGQWGARGADIVVGEGQPLGVPLAGGGPYFGFMATRAALLRQLPGRVVGRTLDGDGRTGYTLTLQAREQHIRRGRANSNICTNQGLLVTAATIYLSLLGARGLERVAGACIHATQQLVSALTALPGVRRAFDGAHFHEAVVVLDRPVAHVLDALAAMGIGGGVDLGRDYPELGHALLVCATETKTTADIRRYVAALEHVLDVKSAA